MKQVWKFEIYTDENPVQMPEGAEILSVSFQEQNLMMWALVDTEAKLVDRHIIARGTGHNIRADNISFIGTAFLDDMVFHVFEID